MSRTEKMLLIEHLDPEISHSELFLSKGLLNKFSWKDDNELLATTGRISRRILDWPEKTMHDSEMNRIELDRPSLKLLQAIEDSPGNALGLLQLDWDISDYCVYGKGAPEAAIAFALSALIFNCMIDSAGLYVESLGAFAGIPAAPA